MASGCTRLNGTLQRREAWVDVQEAKVLRRIAVGRSPWG